MNQSEKLGNENARVSFLQVAIKTTRSKVCKYEVFSVFIPKTGKYGPEETPHLDTFYVVKSDGYPAPCQKVVNCFCKRSITDASQDLKYVSVLHPFFQSGSQAI